MQQLISQAPLPLPAGQRLKVFISYSRRDLAFADWLVEALELNGFDVLIDRRDLPALEDWERELLGFIRAADTVVFVVSPNSLRSKVCAWEVDQVRAHAKRLAPVVIADVEGEPVPSEIARINYIHFMNPEQAADSVGTLVRALKTDLAWLKEHTRIGELARRWTEKGRPADALIRGRDLEDAEGWAARRPLEAPVVTPDMIAFLDACRSDEARRLAAERDQIAATQRFQKRAAWGLAGVALLVAYVLVATLWQARETEKREARVLASAAAKAIEEADYPKAMRIALQALPTPDRIPLLSLGWDAPEMRAAEARLAGAAQKSRLVMEVQDNAAYLGNAVFSPDGSRIYALGFDELAARDASTGKEISRRKLEPSFGKAFGIAISPDGKSLIAGHEDKAARVWDIETGTMRLTLAGHDAYVAGGAFSRDGTRIVTFAGDPDGRVRVWDAATGNLMRALEGHSRGVARAAFDAAGARIVTASSDGSARVWDVQSGQELAILKGHTSFVTDAQFSPDGARVVTASHDRTARAWDAKTGGLLYVLTGHTLGLDSARFSPDGTRILTSSPDGTVRVWDAERGTLQTVLKGEPSLILKAGFSADGRRIVSANNTGLVRTWDVAAEDEMLRLEGNGAAASAAFSPDGSRMALGRAGQVEIWSMAAGTRLSSWPASSYWVLDIAFSPDGKLVAATSDHGAQVWDAGTGVEVATFKGHSNRAQSLAFSPDGAKIATGADDATARIWETRTGRELLVIKDLGGWVAGVKFSPDGTRLATATAGPASARIWDSRDGRRLLALPLDQVHVLDVSFNSDGTKLLTAGSDMVARISDANDGRELVAMRGHTGSVRSAQFSPDESRVVTGSEDRKARVWDAASGAELVSLPGAGGAVLDARFSPDGTRIIVPQNDRNWPQVWDASWLANVRGEELVRRVCSKKLPGETRAFTRADALDPVLEDLAGTNPCERTRPLSWGFWTRPFTEAFDGLVENVGYDRAVLVVFIWLFSGLLCGFIARRSGRYVLPWAISGALFLIPTLPLLLALNWWRRRRAVPARAHATA